MSEENDLELAAMLKAQGEKVLIEIADGTKEEYEPTGICLHYKRCNGCI